MTEAQDEEFAPQSPQTDIGCRDGDDVDDDDLVFSILLELTHFNSQFLNERLSCSAL